MENEWYSFFLGTVSNRHVIHGNNNYDNLKMSDKMKKLFNVECSHHCAVWWKLPAYVNFFFCHFSPFFLRLRKCRCLQLLLKCSSVPLICPREPSLVELQPANWTSGEINGGKWKNYFQSAVFSQFPSCFTCLKILKMMCISGSVVIYCQPWGFTIMVHKWKTTSLSHFTPEPSVWYPQSVISLIQSSSTLLLTHPRWSNLSFNHLLKKHSSGYRC